MNLYIPGIFDDVFGPVMQPGSSSHTAGPCRLGYMTGSLLKAKLKKIKILLDSKGSFAGTFGHMNEDLGMLAGAYGFLPDDERLFDIREILKNEGIEYSFEYVTLKNRHPNAIRFILTDVDGNEYTLEGNSTGGGRVETVNIMGLDIKAYGDSYIYISSKPLHFEDSIKSFRCQDEKNNYYWCTESHKDILEEGIIYKIKPVTETVKAGKVQLFDSFEKWKEESKNYNGCLFETAVRYEMLLIGERRDEIISRMKSRKELMEAETNAPYLNPEGVLETPFSGYHFRKWDSYIEEKKSIQSDLNTKILKYVFAVQALTKGVKLVPGPMGTGGGFLYSALRAFSEEKNISSQKIVESLFVAAGVGIIAYSKTDPTGEITGCTGECGICQAMTAAAITYLSDGSAQQIENAASLALQATLGWACDPIPGGSNQPCLSRFVTGSIMAITFADLALSGRSAVVPFDEVVDVMKKMSEEMPSKLKCTSQGGICESPCAKNCKKNFNEWFYKQGEKK